MMRIVDLEGNPVSETQLTIGEVYIVRRQVRGAVTTTRDLTITPSNGAELVDMQPFGALDFNYMIDTVALDGSVNPSGGLVVYEGFSWKDAYVVRPLASTFTLQAGNDQLDCEASNPPTQNPPSYTVSVVEVWKSKLNPHTEVASVVLSFSGELADTIPVDVQAVAGVVPRVVSVESTADYDFAYDYALQGIAVYNKDGTRVSGTNVTIPRIRLNIFGSSL